KVQVMPSLVNDVTVVRPPPPPVPAPPPLPPPPALPPLPGGLPPPPPLPLGISLVQAAASRLNAARHTSTSCMTPSPPGDPHFSPRPTCGATRGCDGAVHACGRRTTCDRQLELPGAALTCASERLFKAVLMARPMHSRPAMNTRPQFLIVLALVGCGGAQ